MQEMCELLLHSLLPQVTDACYRPAAAKKISNAFT